jgi:hypothetical protein
MCYQILYRYEDTFGVLALGMGNHTLTRVRVSIIFG